MLNNKDLFLNLFDYIEHYGDKTSDIYDNYNIDKSWTHDMSYLKEWIKDIKSVILYIEYDRMRNNIEYSLESDQEKAYFNIVEPDILKLAEETGSIIARPILTFKHENKCSFVIDLYNNKKKILRHHVAYDEYDHYRHYGFSISTLDIQLYGEKQGTEILEHINMLNKVSMIDRREYR